MPGHPCKRPSGYTVFGGGFHAPRVKAAEPRQYVFLEYNPEELQATPDYTPVFRAGDLLAEAPEHRERWLENGKIIQESMLAMVRLEDDVVDSVWPEEVRRLT